MLVFGAVQFMSTRDGGIEIIHNDTHQWLSKDDVQELYGWMMSHIDRSRYNEKLTYNPLNNRYAPVVPAGNMDAAALANTGIFTVLIIVFTLSCLSVALIWMLLH